MKISESLEGKKVLIWGYGREGRSTEHFIKTHCSCQCVDIFEGRQEDIDEDGYDLIIKSPGIVAGHLNEKYTSQTELFLEEFADRTVGITGTKGKSTTSSLLYHVLDECAPQKAFLVGNIGYPCLEVYDELDEDSIIVFEMSCHQLASVHTSPHIAVFLNLYEDHLDYYGTRERYFEAKKNITNFQSKGDFLILGVDVPPIDTDAEKILVTKDIPEPFELKIRGEHNQFNARVVYEISTGIFGCSGALVRESMKGFTGLPHRLEYVARICGVDYYNDSISTIPEATIQAIRSISNTKTVLIGGMDRHIDYDILIDFIKEHDEYCYILSYESGRRIFDEVADLPQCRYVEDLAESVKLANEITPEGSACILSPAAASYGYFKNFEDRGDRFRELVKALQD